ncbi:MAG: hypothetical protein Q9168_005280 [Polycauliona sp. 1 TL-2023]
MATPHGSSQSTASSSYDAFDMDQYINYDPSSYHSDTTQSNPKSIHFDPNDYHNSLLLSQSNQQTFAGPSHQYELHKQQTGLPMGALANTLAVNQNDHIVQGQAQRMSGFPSADFYYSLPTPDDSFDFNTAPSQTMGADMDIDLAASIQDPNADYVNPSAVGGEESSLSSIAPKQRAWPGMHQQQAKAQAEAQRQQTLAQQQQNRPLSRPASQRPLNNPVPAKDPIVEERISRLLDQMRHSSVTSSTDDIATPTAHGNVSHLGRAKKDEEDMDEDERLLASEEGKRLSSKERRQLRNKVSARAFRSRRKEYIGQLEGELATKSAEADELRAKNQELMAENTRLADLTRMLLESPAFSAFLDEMSGAEQQSSTQTRPEARAPKIEDPQQIALKDVDPHQSPLQVSSELDDAPVAMALLPESYINYNTGNNTTWTHNTDFGLYDAQVYAVTSMPEGPAVDHLDTGLLSGKSSALPACFAYGDSKQDVPTIEYPLAPYSESLSQDESTENADEPSLQLDQADLGIALYDDESSAPRITTEDESSAPRITTEDATHKSLLGSSSLAKPSHSFRLQTVDASVGGKVDAAAMQSYRNPLASKTRQISGAAIVAPSIEPLDAFEPSSAVLPRFKRISDAKPFSHFLTDKFHRQHTYLRISVTERCNLRCTYCMPAEGVPLTQPAHLLSTPEIVHLSELFVQEGVNKIRLTGGEPTVRKDILRLMQEIGGLRNKGLKELCLTTNGISLHRKLDAMVEAGLTGVNLSLDTLDPYQFQIMTRRKGFDAVIKSLNRILELNRLGARIKLKINAVIMRGVNESEIIPFVEMGRENDIEVRFIEYMPFDGNKWSKQKMLSYKEMVEIIRHKYPALSKVQEEGKNETSKTWQIPGFVGKVGFITSMTENFCGTCSRLRITADGNLKVCLFGNSEVNLRDLLREENSGESVDWAALERLKHSRGLGGDADHHSEHELRLLEVIGLAVKRKKERHAGMGQLENMKNRPMILIGDGGLLPKPKKSFIQSVAPDPNIGSLYTVLRPRNAIHQVTSIAQNSFTYPHRVYPHASMALFHTIAQVSRASGARRKNIGISFGHDNGKEVKGMPGSSPTRLVSTDCTSQERDAGDTPGSAVGPQREKLPHLSSNSEVHQISVGHKPPTRRVAVAVGLVRFSNLQVLDMIQDHALKKGDVLAVARVAGIMAVKNTSNMIPLAHNNVAVEGCSVDLSLVYPIDDGSAKSWSQESGQIVGASTQPMGACGGVSIKIRCESTGKTGVEMEAMCGVVGSALTVVDMCKAVDKHITIDQVKTIGKKGGKSGDWGIFSEKEGG